MPSLLFDESVLRDNLPISENAAEAGWPRVLYPWFLSVAQLPDADTPKRRAFMRHMVRSIRAGALPFVDKRIEWFIEREVIEPHIEPTDFAAWLQREGFEPSPLIREWLDNYGAALPAEASAVPVQRSTAQEMAVLGSLQELGHDPLALPENPPGKAGIKAQVRGKLEKQLPRMFAPKSTIFNKTWDRLRESGQIAYKP